MGSNEHHGPPWAFPEPFPVAMCGSLCSCGAEKATTKATEPVCSSQLLFDLVIFKATSPQLQNTVFFFAVNADQMVTIGLLVTIICF